MKILIVDDEEIARDYMQDVLSKLLPKAEISHAKDGLEALHQIEKVSPDLVFLDIEMPKLSGIEVAQTVVERNLKIIFTTAYHEHAIKAFELCALDYLLKPFSEERVAEALKKIPKISSYKMKDMSQFQIKKIGLKIEGNYKLLDLSSISCISRSKDYLEVYSGSEIFLVSSTLDSLEEKLPEDKFFRLHRSHIINLDYVDEIKSGADKKNFVLLNDHSRLEVPISREKFSKLKELFSV